MKIRTTLLAAASALALIGGLAAPAGAARAHPLPVPPPINVANDSVHCAAVWGTIKFQAGLHFGGAGVTTAAAALKMADCVAGSFDTTGIHTTGSGKFSFAGVTRNCLSLLGLSVGQTGIGAIKWAREGAASNLALPLSPTFTPTFSTLTIPQTFGSLLNENWSDGNVSSYTYFQFGTDVNHGSTAAPAVANAFTGGDGGIQSSVDLVTSQDYISDSVACTTIGGLKSLLVGIGQLTLN